VTFILACVDCFRNAYVRTGMNLVQSLAVTMLELGREGWRVVSAKRRGVRH